MATISENLQTIKTSTDAIKQAIISKGGEISGNITTWADAISAIESGGITLLGGIKNKLNGSNIAIPTNVIDGDLLYEYQYENLDTTTYGTVYIFMPHYEGTFPLNADWGPHNLDFIVFNLGNTKVMMMQRGVLHNVWNSGFMTNRYRYCLIPKNLSSESNQICYCATSSQATSLSSPKTQFCYIYLVGQRKDNNEFDILDFDTFTYSRDTYACFKEDTEITLSDLSKKKIQDITYNDKLLVWDFDNGCTSTDSVFWIKKEETADYYYHITLENGNIIDLIGSDGKCHRLFNYDDQIFESATDLIGKNIYTRQGIFKVVDCARINESCKFYNIITENHINLFANDMLTSCKYNNALPIVNMRFVKDNVEIDSMKLRKLMLAGFKNNDIKWYNVLKLQYNNDKSIEDTIKYIENCKRLHKNLDDFDDNKEIIKTIQDTEVGWIDREGKSYGFKLYMPGQNNHGILANKICKELNIQTDNPSRYLEKEGWLKYTTDFVLNSDDMEINNNQLESLRKFLKTPNKLKKEGKIRIGDYMSPYVDISEFDTMDKYSFEYIKKHNMR